MNTDPTGVAPELLELVVTLMGIPALADFALGGGTSLALRHGHRRSVDIDMFSTSAFDPILCGDAVVDHFRGLSCDIVNRTPGSLCLLLKGIKIDFLHHPYPILEAFVEKDGIRFISIPDIAAMKINAVTNRGSKKDFADLLLLHDTECSLPQSVDYFLRKYGSAGRFLAIRSLMWFEDAEQEPDPSFLNGWTWNEVKTRMAALARDLAKSTS